MEENEWIMTFKQELDRDLRTIKARDYVLSQRQIRAYRIRGVFNAIGEVSTMDDSYIKDFAMRCFRPEHGEVAAIETGIRNMQGGGRNPLKVVSVIVFVDMWSWNMFAMKHSDVYMKPGMGGFGGLEALMN